MQESTRTNLRRNAAIAAWVLVWLVAFDVAINQAFGVGKRSLRAPELQRYFEYGRSVEGKLARKVVGDPDTDGRILSAGWIEPDLLKKLPDRPQGGADLLVAAYGQSFTMNATFAAATMDRRLTVRGVGGPGAPPSHSYSAYKADVAFRKADVVVFGILSSTIGQMGSMSGLISMFENPAPFTYPRYRLDGARLTEELPVIRDEAQFRDAFVRRSGDWQRFKGQLKQSDRGYDPFVLDETVADSSSVVRLVRRGWVAHRQSYDAGVYAPGEGFNPEAQDVLVLKAMIVDLARQTRARGERLIVLLLHTRGHADHLHALLEGTLKQANIEYVSSHAQFTANDAGNFVSDGHYTEAANSRLAAALQAKIRMAQPAAIQPAVQPDRAEQQR